MTLRLGVTGVRPFSATICHARGTLGWASAIAATIPSIVASVASAAGSKPFSRSASEVSELMLASLVRRSRSAPNSFTSDRAIALLVTVTQSMRPASRAATTSGRASLHPHASRPPPRSRAPQPSAVLGSRVHDRDWRESARRVCRRPEVRVRRLTLRRDRSPAPGRLSVSIQPVRFRSLVRRKRVCSSRIGARRNGDGNCPQEMLDTVAA